MNTREKTQWQIDMVFRFEMTLAIVTVSTGLATFVTQMVDPTIIDLKHMRWLGLTNVGLLLILLTAKMWRKRMKRSLTEKTRITSKG